MNNPLKAAIAAVLDLSYPNSWSTVWLKLPLDPGRLQSPYRFHVICSDLADIKQDQPSWPPRIQDPKVWIQWRPSDGPGLWIRPRRHDPILRDRLILMEPAEMCSDTPRRIISRRSLYDACVFSATSDRIVWHNPPNGGASSPESAHFQSMPLSWRDGTALTFTLPCCYFRPLNTGLRKNTETLATLLEPGLGPGQYPVRGAVLTGSPADVSERAWSIIWDYDRALSCNIIIQPMVSRGLSDVRTFLFPRHRNGLGHVVRGHLLSKDEKDLLKNNRGGVDYEWSFAGIEMGLLTQVEWGPFFDQMRSAPERWGLTLYRLLRELSLGEQDNDWREFLALVTAR